MKKVFLIAAVGALCALFSGCGIMGRFNEMFGSGACQIDMSTAGGGIKIR